MVHYWRALLILALLLALPGAVLADGPEGWMSIPDVGLYKAISYTPITHRDYDLTTLGHGVTRLEGTGDLDATWGRIVLAGHNPGGFTPLFDLDVGDVIILVSHHDTRVWVIVEALKVGDDLVYLSPTNDLTLTLITCWDEGNTWLVINAKPVVQ